MHCEFSIRKGKPRYCNGTKNIKQREFLCSKEGFKLDEDFCKDKYSKRLETRIGCKAFVRFTVENGVSRVSAFNPEHNHELALQSERHLLRSGRRISKPKADVIDTMVNAGISTKNAYSYLTKEVGGSENVGFTERDCYNHVNVQKMTMISAGDAQSLLNHFKSKHVEDPMFFYTVQVDQENRMTNFLWRDGRSRVDYDCFGDVVVFDTTYRTNKYNLICTPFVGVNHSWQNVMFGCAFLLDETIDSFKWSESTNHVLNGIANKSISLTKFVIEYGNALADMRSSELDEDFRCKQGAPQKVVKKSGILGHAAQVYTCKIFNLFENQFLNSLAMVWDQVDCQDKIGVFEVKEENSERVCIVRFDNFNSNISCSCKKFESLGILCCHALQVFSIKNLTRIPSQYILKRWTKEAKKGMMTYKQDNHSLSNDKEANIVWRNSMMRIANIVISKSQGEDSLKRICQKLLLELDEKIERELSRIKVGVDANVEENEVIQCDTTDEMPCLPNEVLVLNPPCVRSKGLRNNSLKGTLRSARQTHLKMHLLQEKENKKQLKNIQMSHWVAHTIHQSINHLIPTLIQTLQVLTYMVNLTRLGQCILRNELCKCTIYIYVARYRCCSPT
ncbi:hypothetical protein RGQ29_016852 [Quercus rubra]|uniref:SWIM-type domain-containing protein n=1 Tax=Quercus rubra TaxID=3512 RepID=A0AAN7FF75_QUERU|nr:hypothetical protein RGQ29_016852 [Quercus rubra]